MILDPKLADELVEVLQHNHDVGLDVLTKMRVGSLGPLLRLLMGSQRAREIVRGTLIDDARVQVALQFIDVVYEHNFTDLAPKQWGVAQVPVNGGSDDPVWDAFLWRLRRSAEHFGISKPVSHAAAQATYELAENVLEHSDAPTTGIAYFDAADDTFEIGVIDSGNGMLNSLRRNPAFAQLPDDLAALREGIKDGISRFGASDRGFGFRAVFRVLRNLGGSARLQSGIAAIDVNPDGSNGYDHVGWQVTYYQGLWVRASISAK